MQPGQVTREPSRGGPREARCKLMDRALQKSAYSIVAMGHSQPGSNQQQVQPCPLSPIASLIGHSGSSAFRPPPPLQCRCRSRARASLRNRHQGPSIMGVEDEVEQSTERPCRQTNGRSKRTCELTSSIVPRGTSFHRSVELEFPPIGFDPARLSCCCSLFPCPPELGAVNPDAVHDHGQADVPEPRSPFSCRGAWRSASPRP